MPVPLMDIRGQYEDLLGDVKRSVCEVIDSGRFILGPNMRALEDEVASARGAGSFGDLATFSFFPTKNFPAFGDAGMVVSGSADLAERVRLLRFHGSREKRRFEIVGTNSRMDEIQAAVLRRFLPEVAGWNAARRAAADRYRALGLGDLVELPVAAPGADHVY